MNDTITITAEERAEIRRLASQTHRLSFNDKLHEKLDKLLNALEQAEANVARLTKERDWLANNLIDCPRFTNCAVDCAECRKEAASRAVAAGEE